MKKSLLLASLLLVSSFAAACADQGEVDANSGLRSVVLAADGIDGFKYTVTRVDCEAYPYAGDPVVVEGTAPLLSGQTLPGTLETFLNRPFAAGSTHAFADKFFTLDAGCYDVTATPYGEGAASCSSATLKAVAVNEGVTSEVLLISQCLGVDKGALDVIATTNHDPVIDNVYFPTSKFSCAEPTTICVTAHDPDSDPLRYEVTFAEGTPCSAVEWTETDAGDHCAVLTCSAPGSYAPLVTVYDQAYNDAAELVDIEDLLVTYGTSGEGWTSQASLEAVIHVDGYAGYTDADGDHYGAGEYIFTCTPPLIALAPKAGDCNDAVSSINPAAAEVCGDGVDNNCNEVVDEGCDGDCAGKPFDPGNGIVGCWYTSPELGLTCAQVCEAHGGFDAVASQHTGNDVGQYFWPDKADGYDWVSIECSSTDNNTNWGANGSTPDANFTHPACYVNCACNN